MKRKRTPRKQSKLMANRAKWMRNGSQTVHEGLTKHVLRSICAEMGLTPKNQKIFYDCENKKWYIADFFIPEAGLVIEVDGASHDKRKEYDAKRTQFLEKLGLKVCRFRNEEAEDLEYREKLRKAIKAAKSRPHIPRLTRRNMEMRAAILCVRQRPSDSGPKHTREEIEGLTAEFLERGGKIKRIGRA